MTTPLMEQMAEALDLLISKLRPNVNGADETYFFIGLKQQVTTAEMRQVCEVLSAYRQQAAEPALKPVGDVVVLRRKRDGGVSRLSRIMDRSKDLESCLLHWRDTYTDELWDIEVCQIFSKSKAPVSAMRGEKADG